MINNLYDLSITIVGPGLPLEFQFIYAIITLLLSLTMLFIIFSPIFICLSFVRGR